MDQTGSPVCFDAKIKRIVKAVNEALGKIEGGASVRHRLQVDR